MEVGDRVKILKSGHPAYSKEGWILEISIHKDGDTFILVGFIPLIPSPIFGDSIFDLNCIEEEGNGYVLGLHHLEVVENREDFDYQRIVDGIIDVIEDRGCPIRFHSNKPEYSNYHNWPWRDPEKDTEEWMKKHYPEMLETTG